MCRVLKVHRSGYYAWLKTPLSPRSIVNQSLSKQIRHFYDLSNGIYGSPRIFMDLKEAGVECGENRVARLMKAAQIRSVRGYKPHAIRLVGRHLWRPISCSVSLPMSSQTRLG